MTVGHSDIGDLSAVVRMSCSAAHLAVCDKWQDFTWSKDHWLVAWHSGRTLVFRRRTFPV